MRSFRKRAPVLLALLAGGVAATSCGQPRIPALPAVEPAPLPDPGEVESVIFFLGDPGEAIETHYPILPKLKSEVEAWSGALKTDSAVSIVVLGDIVYPEGLVDPGAAGYERGVEIIEDQFDLIRGPEASRYNSMLLYVAGNHDWGSMRGEEGVRRLRNIENHVRRFNSEGYPAELIPEAGKPGPGVIDIGEHIRLLLLDTTWWLFQENWAEKDAFIERISEAFETRGERHIVLASHHPMESGGSHSGTFDFWDTLGLRYYLFKSGALIQDLNSRPYADLRERLRALFATYERPMLYAGGHDHSLQVISATSPEESHYMLVSGSASKLTSVGFAEGMLYRKTAPGYAYVVTKKNGQSYLFVVSSEPRYLACGDEVEENIQECMRKGVESYEITFSMRLYDPSY